MIITNEAEHAALRETARKLSDSELRAFCDDADILGLAVYGLSDWHLACYDVADERWPR